MYHVDDQIQPEHIRLLVRLTTLTGLFLGLLYATTYIIHYDVEQMLGRGVEFAVHGKLIFYGNASSAGMGNVPGALTSLLVGLPLKIWFSPYSVLIVLGLIHLFAFIILYRTLSQFFTPIIMLLFTLLYWLSPWHVSEFYIWNPSYLFFPMALHFWSASRLGGQPRFWASFWHVTAIGLAFQIHNSSIILLFMTLFLIWRKQLRLNWTAAAIALLVVVASLIPYFSALLNEPELAPTIKDERFFLFRGLIFVFPILKAIIYWLRFGSTVFPKHIFQNLDLNWVVNENLRILVNTFVVIVKYSAAIVTGALSININWHYFKKHKDVLKVWQPPTADPWLDQYCMAGFFALVVAAALSPIDLIYWHLIILYPVALIPILQYLASSEIIKKPDRLILGLFIFFSAYNIVAAVGSEKHTIYSRPQHDFLYEYHNK